MRGRLISNKLSFKRSIFGSENNFEMAKSQFTQRSIKRFDSTVTTKHFETKFQNF